MLRCCPPQACPWTDPRLQPMSKSASNLEVRDELDVFPKSFTSMLLTGDRQLDSLLRRVQSKITERVSARLLQWSARRLLILLLLLRALLLLLG